MFIHDKQNFQQLSIYTSKWYIIKNMLQSEEYAQFTGLSSFHLALFPSILAKIAYAQYARWTATAHAFAPPQNREAKSITGVCVCIHFYRGMI